MKSNKQQTHLMIGIALLVAAGVLFYIALSAPRVYVRPESKNTVTVTVVPTAPSSAVLAPTQKEEVQFPLNINTATAEELMEIDGLGEKRAQAVVEYREVLGGYTSVEQIKEIKGFGDGLYDKVAPYLTVG